MIVLILESEIEEGSNIQYKLDVENLYMPGWELLLFNQFFIDRASFEPRTLRVTIEFDNVPK